MLRTVTSGGGELANSVTFYCVSIFAILVSISVNDLQHCRAKFPSTALSSLSNDIFAGQVIKIFIKKR